VPAAQLQPGDLLSSHDGQWVPVEEVYDTGEPETVYNLRVADFHTYFVGSEEWGFSVWAHNAYGDVGDHRPYSRDTNGRWRDARGRYASAPVISSQKQDGHVVGTPQPNQSGEGWETNIDVL